MTNLDRKDLEVRYEMFDQFALIDQRAYYLKTVEKHDEASGQVNRIRASISLFTGIAAAVAGFQHADQLGFRLRRDDDVAGDRFELLLQDGAVPVEIAALLLDDGWIVLDLDAGDVRLERRDVHQGCPTVSSSSE